jgi:phage terminase large subunit
VFLDIDDYTQGDSIEGLNWATDKAIQAQADLFVWDCDGIGSGMKESITRIFKGKKIELEMFKGSSTPDNPDAIYSGNVADVKGQTSNRQTFKNNRACRYWKLRDRFYNTYEAVTKGKYIDPETLISISSDIKKIQAIRAEICRLPRKFGGNGLIQLMTKQEMLAKGIRSPNMADPMMMSMSDFKKVQAQTLNFASAW